MSQTNEHLVRAHELWHKLKTDPFSGSESPQAIITLLLRELGNGGQNPAYLDRDPAGNPRRNRDEMEREIYRAGMAAEVKKANSLANPWVRRAELSDFGSEALLATYIADRLEFAYRFAQKVDKSVRPPGTLLRRRGDITMEELVPLCDAAKKLQLLLKKV